MNLHLSNQFTDNDGVKLHYMAGGAGPLVVLVHGFPDFWYTWRHQLDPIARTHSLAAMDTRGYNFSDQPNGQAQYGIELLVSDVAAVIASEGHESAVVIGHDWGAVTAWHLAASRPDLVDGLVIINMPHPDRISTTLQSVDGEQALALAYTRNFRRPGSETAFTSAGLADFMSGEDPEIRARYLEAFERTSLTAAMNYYRRNSRDHGPQQALDAIHAPVLQFHGLDDPALLASTLNDTWRHLTNTWSLVTIPGAGHWPHHDRPELVTSALTSWLDDLERAKLDIAASPEAPAEPAGTSTGCCGPPHEPDEPAALGCCR